LHGELHGTAISDFSVSFPVASSFSFCLVSSTLWAPSIASKDLEKYPQLRDTVAAKDFVFGASGEIPTGSSAQFADGTPGD
jgi:hypothetical protein